MKKIAILSASVRQGRNSHRVALYFKNYIETNKLAEVEILDLNEYQFPIFEERLRFQKDPSMETLEFAQKISDADGLLIVTPEYNGGYPASLKNVIDLVDDKLKRKPIAISTVSSGAFGGSQVITSLVFTLWKIGAFLATAMFPVPNVELSFQESGAATDQEKTDKRAVKFVEELLWCVNAKSKMST